ncbi:MAG: sensor histidine kinase [Lachnospiraceae bacterium]|nr:sensor histidine kinase [Lachnospiraceae bacterium]
MKFSKYILDHKIWPGIGAFLIFTIDVFLMTMKASLYLMIYVAAAVAAGIFLGMYLDFAQKRRFLKELRLNADMLDEKYLVADLMPEPETAEEEEIRGILADMERSMSGKVADYRRRSEEYKEYIETWVHEIKVPISTAKMIMENHRTDTVGESGLIDEAERISACVEQALFYARSEAVEKDYFVKRLSLASITGDAITARKRALIAMGASIDMSGLEGAPEVISDGKWLTFILGQIIDNSIKYAREGEKLRLVFEAGNEDGRVTLSVRDNGIGMKEEEIERAFEKGFTGSNGRTGRASTGIGLYLCRKLCLRLEHDIRIESKAGDGTTVILRF